jgi:hypothetical protein
MGNNDMRANMKSMINYGNPCKEVHYHSIREKNGAYRGKSTHQNMVELAKYSEDDNR